MHTNEPAAACEGMASTGLRTSEPPAAVVPSLEDMLLRWRKRRSTSLRNLIVERCGDIVVSMARTLAHRLPPSVDAQDLIHAGMWGLMQAVEKYDPARCDQFVAFMRIRVHGAMIDELRHMDFLPRLYRRRLRDRAHALARLRADLSREPSDAELAAELGVTPAELQRAYCDRPMMQGSQVPSGQDGAGDEALDGLDRLCDEANEPPIEAINRQELVDKIRASLTPIEWRVLELHYLEGMSGKEVANCLQLSASRICQIHGRVLGRLKVRLSELQ